MLIKHLEQVIKTELVLNLAHTNATLIYTVHVSPLWTRTPIALHSDTPFLEKHGSQPVMYTSRDYYWHSNWSNTELHGTVQNWIKLLRFILGRSIQPMNTIVYSLMQLSGQQQKTSCACRDLQWVRDKRRKVTGGVQHVGGAPCVAHTQPHVPPKEHLPQRGVLEPASGEGTSHLRHVGRYKGRPGDIVTHSCSFLLIWLYYYYKQP